MKITPAFRQLLLERSWRPTRSRTPRRRRPRAGCTPAEDLLLAQRDAELLVGAQDLGSTSSRVFGAAFIFGAR
jgi:hypothetical protein